MSELDTLNSKSVADLAVIATAMGVTNPGDADKLSKEELMHPITDNQLTVVRAMHDNPRL